MLVCVRPLLVQALGLGPKDQQSSDNRSGNRTCKGDIRVKLERWKSHEHPAEVEDQPDRPHSGDEEVERYVDRAAQHRDGRRRFIFRLLQRRRHVLRALRHRVRNSGRWGGIGGDGGLGVLSAGRSSAIESTQEHVEPDRGDQVGDGNGMPSLVLLRRFRGEEILVARG